MENFKYYSPKNLLMELEVDQRIKLIQKDTLLKVGRTKSPWGNVGELFCSYPEAFGEAVTTRRWVWLIKMKKFPCPVVNSMRRQI